MKLGPLRPEHRKPQPKRATPGALAKARREEDARYAREADETQRRLRREFFERQGRAGA
jgi:hypothetical protein